MAFGTQPPKNWDNLQNKPDWIVDNQANWGDIPDKPLSVINWEIPGGFDFVNGAYRNLGNFPISVNVQTAAHQHYIYLMQLHIQWSELNYHSILGSTIFSAIPWLVHPWERLEQQIKCESHFWFPTIATFYLAEGVSYRDFYLKIDRDLNIPLEGKVNIKIAGIV